MKIDTDLLSSPVALTLASRASISEHVVTFSLPPRSHADLLGSLPLAQRYEEAASHIVTALRLQQNDSTEDLPGHAKGVGSAALWETLRNTCSYMHRPDLVELCIKWDLDGAYQRVLRK